MDEAGLSVVLRDYDPERDVAMVYSTWRNNAYHSAAIKPKQDEKAWFSAYTFKIKEILRTSIVKIACFEDTPSVIVGYVVYSGMGVDGLHLHWIYVKGDYRNKGIGTMLYPKEIQTVTPDLTKIGLEIVNKKKLTVKGD